MGGRFILVKAMLENIPIYWFSLAKIPKFILDHIRRKIFSFLWGDKKEKPFFHLIKWQFLARPGSCGGWGFKNIYLFGLALATKILWRGLFFLGM